MIETFQKISSGLKIAVFLELKACNFWIGISTGGTPVT
jgi:hypothetical protein